MTACHIPPRRPERMRHFTTQTDVYTGCARAPDTNSFNSSTLKIKTHARSSQVGCCVSSHDSRQIKSVGRSQDTGKQRRAVRGEKRMAGQHNHTKNSQRKAVRFGWLTRLAHAQVPGDPVTRRTCVPCASCEAKNTASSSRAAINLNLSATSRLSKKNKTPS